MAEKIKIFVEKNISERASYLEIADVKFWKNRKSLIKVAVNILKPTSYLVLHMWMVRSNVTRKFVWEKW